MDVVLRERGWNNVIGAGIGSYWCTVVGCSFGREVFNLKAGKKRTVQRGLESL